MSDRSTTEGLPGRDTTRPPAGPTSSAGTASTTGPDRTAGATDRAYAGSRSATSGKSAGQLMKEITEDLSALFRKEIELAKQEVGGSVKARAKGAAIIAIAGVFALFALMFLLLAIRDGFDTFLWTWVADIATALVLLVLGGIAALVARKKLQTPISADLTKQTVKEDIEWAKSVGKR